MGTFLLFCNIMTLKALIGRGNNIKYIHSSIYFPICLSSQVLRECRSLSQLTSVTMGVTSLCLILSNIGVFLVGGGGIAYHLSSSVFFRHDLWFLFFFTLKQVIFTFLCCDLILVCHSWLALPPPTYIFRRHATCASFMRLKSKHFASSGIGKYCCRW